MGRTQALAFAIRTRPITSTSRMKTWPSPTHTLSRPAARDTIRNLASSSKQPLRRGTARSLVRLFTTRTLQAYLNERHRPQLPFLHVPSFARAKVPRELPLSVALFTRQISSQRKERWKAQLRWQLRFQAYLWPFLVLLALLYMGVQQTRFEHQFPTPHEWSLWARWELRTAYWLQESAEGKLWGVVVDWGKVGEYLLRLEAQLEDPKGDGKGTVMPSLTEAENLSDDTNYWTRSVEGKSEEWRRGYFQCLMGLARVAENLDGMYMRRDEKTKKGLRAKTYRESHLVGGSNPRPEPLPWDKHGDHLNPPKADEVVRAFHEPLDRYRKILTVQGFTDRQYLEATLAMADYCDYAGDEWRSGVEYEAALRNAAAALPANKDRDRHGKGLDVVDLRTGVILAGKETLVSENLLRATTAWAVHKARHGYVKEALPSFLSVLRARRSLPAAPPGYERSMSGRSSSSENRGLTGWFQSIKEFVSEVPYPEASSSGNEPPFHTLNEACEEVGLMTYIGEILFATSEQGREKGLSWTRDSVEAAEAVMWFMDEDELGKGTTATGRKRCQECLETGLQNWSQMTQLMAKLARQKQNEAAEWKGVLGTGYGRSDAMNRASKEVERWKEEEAQIELRLQKTASLVNPLKPQDGRSFASV